MCDIFAIYYDCADKAGAGAGGGGGGDGGARCLGVSDGRLVAFATRSSDIINYVDKYLI